MEKIIELDINKKNDLVERYNEDKVRNELIKYIIRQTILIKKDTKIKIIINKKNDVDKDCVNLIKEGLKEEFQRSIAKRDRNNKKQLFFLFLGMFFIFLSTLIEKQMVWKEILLITGWVPIWEMIKVELFPDVYGRKERRIIKRLLNSEIIEKRS